MSAFDADVASMRTLVVTALVVVACIAIVAAWAMGWTVQMGNGYIKFVGPASVHPYAAEAEANSPECQGLREKFPEKTSYTAEEFEARSKAAKACIDAKIRYIRNKEKAR
jgi:hypothetical protein